MYRAPSSGYESKYDNFYFGLFGFRASSDSECISYNEDGYEEDDSALGAGRAFAIFSVVFGGTLIALNVFGFFFVYSAQSWSIVIVEHFVVGIFTILPLSALGYLQCSTEHDRYEEYCSPGEGAMSSIFACIFWIVSGILVCQMPKPEKPLINCCGDNADSGSCCNQGGNGNRNESIVAVNSVRGKTVVKRITEEVVHPDGTKSVTTREVTEDV